MTRADPRASCLQGGHALPGPGKIGAPSAKISVSVDDTSLVSASPVHPVAGQVGGDAPGLLLIVGKNDQGPACVPRKLRQQPAFGRHGQPFKLCDAACGDRLS